eukprot:TRINITY_DN303_c2_g1_i2.p1 TRINITY_DN303_c2_g1~~TRINITY_DN303_c2_g1_i2.p1  ORF type:complete len:454 (-),score=92.77 TRINITY_DN303_c2_g1_i2:424-1785(-)
MAATLHEQLAALNQEYYKEGHISKAQYDSLRQQFLNSFVQGQAAPTNGYTAPCKGCVAHTHAPSLHVNGMVRVACKCRVPSNGHATLSARLSALNQRQEAGEIGKSEYQEVRQRVLAEFVQFGHSVRSDELMNHGLEEGFSMAEALQYADEGQKTAMARKPREVLADLQRGNARFWTGQSHGSESSAFERRALLSKQFPTVAVVGCADSRVPVELVFDQGLGDMFVVRNAGNCLGTSAIASLQYAVHNLNVKVILIMGHEGCGAVKAATSSLDALDGFPGELSGWLKKVREGLDAERVGLVRDAIAKDREAVVSNVRHQVARLSHDAGIMEKVRNNDLTITGAFYELSSGIVDFFEDITDATKPERVSYLRRKSTNPGEFNMKALSALSERKGEDDLAVGRRDSFGVRLMEAAAAEERRKNTVEKKSKRLRFLRWLNLCSPSEETGLLTNGCS